VKTRTLKNEGCGTQEKTVLTQQADDGGGHQVGHGAG